jgi:hypothetical protein
MPPVPSAIYEFIKSLDTFRGMCHQQAVVNRFFNRFNHGRTQNTHHWPRLNTVPRLTMPGKVALLSKLIPGR